MEFSTAKRGALWLLYNLLARHLPRSYVAYSLGARRIRAFILSRLFKAFGRNVNIEAKVIFYCMVEPEIGDNSGIGMGSFVGLVKIGRDVMIGEEFMAITQNHICDNPSIPMREQGVHQHMPITIKDDVWIGSRVTVLPGVTIERGAVVGAGSVVTTDVEAYSIVAGNPAREIGRRK